MLLQFFLLKLDGIRLAYIFGIIIGWFYCVNFLINDEEMKKKFEDFISFLIIGIILGGRIGYVFFIIQVTILKILLETIKIWKGGHVISWGGYWNIIS